MSSRSVPSAFLKSVLQNGVGRYVGQLQRLTLKFCKSHADSYGMRCFIENDLLEFTRRNPGVVVYLQPRRHRTPRIVGEYLNQEVVQLYSRNYTQEEVRQWVEHLRTRSGVPIVRLRRSWHTDVPSVQGVWTPYTNRDTRLNLVTFPSTELSERQPDELSATDRLLQLARELRAQDNVVVDESEQ